MSHTRRARRALGQLGEIDPGLAALALWCTHRDAGGATRTEGETILYGAEFEALPMPEQVGLAAHHVLHVALRHAPRQDALAERLGPRFDADLYGIAADAVVNETLILAGHALPRPRVTLCELLKAVGLRAASAPEALAEWDADRLAMHLHRDRRIAQKAKEHGKAQGFVRDLDPGRSGAPDQGADAWAGHMRRAMGVGRGAGAGIGALLGTLADIAPPRIPWEHHLRRLLARALIEAPRATWRRPSGRWTARESAARAEGADPPPFEPGRQRADHLPRVVAAVDTSSSIDAQTLALFSSELRAIARRSGAETFVLGFDDEIHFERRFGPGGGDLPEPPRMRTGGGTAFAPVMQACRRLAPSVAVVLTDLDAPHADPPGCPVIWVAPEDAPVPPFGRLVALVG